MLSIQNNLKVSEKAENLIGSEIIKLAGEINEKIKQGQKIYNLTIGDFNAKLYPIPKELKNLISEAYQNDETNYPPADGMLALREQISMFLNHYGELSYSPSEILIAGGARPLIYATFLTLVNEGEKVIFPVPSWNNNHYCHLHKAQQVVIEAKPENNFMPTAADIKPYIKDAAMIALCSPLNPTGTVFNKETLTEICDIILEENKRRKPNEKPLYLMYDQIYWMLTYGNTVHYNPVILRPEMKDFTIFIDGLSKAFAATGVRVGWTFGPKKVIDKMKSVLGHIGAWAPKAEQVAVSKYLQNTEQIDQYISNLKLKLLSSLEGLYQGFVALEKDGFPIKAIHPQAAMYLTVQINLIGFQLPNGEIIKNTSQITAFLLNEAGFAVVPFSAFGAELDSTWYRISVGNCSSNEIPSILSAFKNALLKLTH
ncbi:MAG TPA: aminotransferase class I/II-fold pyridoxal phosphate-dependent enzyme [Bacteroidia bacterium]|nr:aminotransferase class I/II-fold pyridoxal phosphate-dependent enzyme [Bacteroidia bacterium]